MSELLKRDLQDQLLRGQALIIVGSGVSIGATGGRYEASWTGLLRNGAERCNQIIPNLPRGWSKRLEAQIASGDVNELVSAAENISSRLGSPDKGEFRKWLRETVGSLTAANPDVLKALADLGAPLATTNYDGLLEEVTGWPPVTWKDPARILKVLRGDDRAIIHLHGHWAEPESVLLGFRSYQELLGDDRAKAIQEALALTRTLVFVGCGEGLTDPNLGRLLDWLERRFSQSEYRHYHLVRNGDVGKLNRRYDSSRLFALPYGSRHEDLQHFLKCLLPSSEALRAKDRQSCSVPVRGTPRLHSEESPEPRFSSDRTRNLSHKLEQLYIQKEEGVIKGSNTSEIEGEIVYLKRHLRSGVQLEAGEFLLEGRFRLLEIVGRGGFAEVWKAYDRRAQAIVALKLLHGQYSRDISHRERFFRGAHKMAELQHQYIVQVLERELEDSGYHFFSMEYVEGIDLQRDISDKNRSLAERLSIIYKVGEALHFAHSKGVVHRDIKPANILIDKQGNPKLTDFDLVRAFDTTGGTRTGAMLGTFIYAAPELMQDPQAAGIPADVFGLGMTVISAACGSLPPPEALRDAKKFVKRLDMPAPMKPVLSRAVSWDFRRRFRSIRDFCLALRAAQENPILATATGLSKSRSNMPLEATQTDYVPRLRPVASAGRKQDEKESSARGPRRALFSFFGSRRNADYVRKADQEFQKGNLEKAAQLYIQGNRIRQAADMYVELQELDKAVELYDSNKMLVEAGDLLSSRGLHRKAVVRYEKAGAFLKAAESALKIRNYTRAAHLFKKAGMFDQAAHNFAKAGEVEDAARAWELRSEQLRQDRRGEFNYGLEKKIREVDVRRAELLISLGRHLEAAWLLDEHGLVEKSAPLLESVGHFSEASRAFLEANRPQDALRALKNAPEVDDELRAEIYLSCSRHTDAARLYEKIGRFDAAANAYEGDEAWAKAAEMWERVGAFDRAAFFYYQEENYEKAARCFAASGQQNDAAEAFSMAGLYAQAAAAYSEIGRYLDAGRNYTQAGDLAAAQEALQTVSSGSDDYAAASLELIQLLVEDGAAEGAQHRWALLKAEGIEVEGPIMLYLEGRILEANARYPEAAAAYQKTLAEVHGFRDALERLANVQGKISSEPSAPQDVAVSVPPQAVISIAGIESILAGGSESGAHVGSVSSLAKLSSHSQFPFELGSEIPPWWDGASFFRATDNRYGRQVSLVAFPLSTVANYAEDLESAVQDSSFLKSSFILDLKEVLVASDKVLLLYESVFAEPLIYKQADAKLQPSLVLSIVAQVSDALAVAHRVGLIHQRISPHTLLLEDQDSVKLVGLGLHRILAECDRNSSGYLSPEVRSGRLIGPASDVFSLALTTVALLQGKLPAKWWELECVELDSVTWPREVEASVPEVFLRTVIQGLSRQALLRPSAEAFRIALQTE